MNRIVTKPTRIDLHIHSAASTATKDKGNKELADCDKGHVDVLLRGLEAHGINMCAITDHDCFDKDLYFALKEREGGWLPEQSASRRRVQRVHSRRRRGADCHPYRSHLR